MTDKEHQLLVALRHWARLHRAYWNGATSEQIKRNPSAARFVPSRAALNKAERELLELEATLSPETR